MRWTVRHPNSQTRALHTRSMQWATTCAAIAREARSLQRVRAKCPSLLGAPIKRTHALTVLLARRARRHSRHSLVLNVRSENTLWAVRLSAQFVTTLKFQIATQLAQNRAFFVLAAKVRTLLEPRVTTATLGCSHRQVRVRDALVIRCRIVKELPRRAFTALTKHK